MSMIATPGAAKVEKEKAALPQFKQYRGAGGWFYFKLVDGDGNLLMYTNSGFESPKDAGAWIARFKEEGSRAVTDAENASIFLETGREDDARDALDAICAEHAAKP